MLFVLCLRILKMGSLVSFLLCVWLIKPKTFSNVRGLRTDLKMSEKSSNVERKTFRKPGNCERNEGLSRDFCIEYTFPCVKKTKSLQRLICTENNDQATICWKQLSGIYRISRVLVLLSDEEHQKINQK